MTPAAWRSEERLNPEAAEAFQRPPLARRASFQRAPSTASSTVAEGARAVLEALLSRDPNTPAARPEAPR